MLSVLTGFQNNLGQLIKLLYDNTASRELGCIIRDFQIFVNIQLQRQHSNMLQQHIPGQIVHFDLDRCYTNEYGVYNGGVLNSPTQHMKSKLLSCYNGTDQQLLQYIQEVTSNTVAKHNNTVA